MSHAESPLTSYSLHEGLSMLERKVKLTAESRRSLYTLEEIGEKDRSLIENFSLMKLGDTNSITRFSNELIDYLRPFSGERTDRGTIVICSPPSTIQHAAGLMTAQIADALSYPVIEIRKSRPLGDYSLLDKPLDREKAVANTMSVKEPEQIRDKEVIVIDDVWVTGTVAKELVRALYESRAKQVRIVTVLELGGSDPSLEGRINEVAIPDKLPKILESVNTQPTITSAFLKAMVRLSKNQPELFSEAMNQLSLNSRLSLFFSCMSYHMKTKAEEGFLYPDEEFMQDFNNFLPESSGRLIFI